MSAFQLQEWWGTQVCNTPEEFDYGCMAIGNIDNANPPSDKIAIGSQQGMLRIYNPSHASFRMEDLMVEESLHEPILQLLIGLFIPSTDALGLAVLHPRRLVVYELLVNQGRDGRVNYYSLQKLYEHNLGIEGKHFTAYNMISGTLGGAKGREVIVVQSLDGKLQLFEQSATAFTRQLVDCLMPGPIWYWPRCDSLITTNDDNNIECYKYQVLASSQGDVVGPRSEDKKSNKYQVAAVRSTMVEWGILLGEPTKQIIDGHFSSIDSSKPKGTFPSNELLVLTEHSIFLIKETGNILQQRRLEVDPSCICVYDVGTSGSQNFIVASHDKTIHVFRELNLVWAAKLASVPVQMSINDFGGTTSLIVTINESGYLSISYLGTKPPVTAVVSSNISRDVDYDKIDEEHRSLLQVIRESQNDQKQEPREKVNLRTQISKLLDVETISGIEGRVEMAKNPALIRPLSDVTGSDGSRNLAKISIKLYVSYIGGHSSTNVSVGVTVPENIHMLPNSVIIPTMKAVRTTPQLIKFYMISTKECLPSSLSASFSASYTCSSGEPRITSLPFTIPLHLVCQPRPPSKNALYKVTLDTVANAFPLTELFDDFLYAIQESNVVNVRDVLGNVGAQAIGFQFYCSHAIDVSKLVNYINSMNGSLASTEADDATGIMPKKKDLPISSFSNSDATIPSLVSILVSKNAGRYRIQSDSLAAIYLIASELERRLLVKTSSSSASAASEEKSGSLSPISCSDNLYLDEFYAIIDLHFQIRLSVLNLLSQLNDRAHQFRMVQKRLLVRYKDRNPTPMSGIDILMRETYEAILKLSKSR
jgi:Bardet-Biedl syndrome 9 protein